MTSWRGDCKCLNFQSSSLCRAKCFYVHKFTRRENLLVVLFELTHKLAELTLFRPSHLLSSPFLMYTFVLSAFARLFTSLLYATQRCRALARVTLVEARNKCRTVSYLRHLDLFEKNIAKCCMTIHERLATSTIQTPRHFMNKVLLIHLSRSFIRIIVIKASCAPLFPSHFPNEKLFNLDNRRSEAKRKVVS